MNTIPKLADINLPETIAAHADKADGWVITYVPQGGLILDGYIPSVDGTDRVVERINEIMANDAQEISIQAVLETITIAES